MKSASLGIRLLVSLSFLASAFTPAARAQQLRSYSVVGGESASGGVVNQAQLCSQTSVSSPVAKTNCSGSYTALSTTGSATAQAIATYGILRADSTATSQAPPGNPQPLATASAFAEFTDSLTFTGLSQPATLDATFTISGFLTSINFGDTSSSVNFTTDFAGLSPFCTLLAAGTCMISASVNDSSAVQLEAALNTVAAVSATTFGSGSASSNFLDTAMVDSLILVDANGNPISGANIIAASGTNYNALTETPPPTAAPEPSSLILLGSGAIGFVWIMRRKMRV